MNTAKHCRRVWRHHGPHLTAVVLLVLALATFLVIHPKGASVGVLSTWSNQIAGQALLAAGQTIVVLTGGIDISIGSIMALANSLASELLYGDVERIAIGVFVVLLVGAFCGLINGLVIVFCRIPPIVATLGTSAIFSGLALAVRPAPGGNVSDSLSDGLTGTLFGGLPTSLLLFLGAVILFWAPVQRSLVGRALYAVGSSEPSAYLSGLPVKRVKVTAYAMAGVFAALAGMYMAIQTQSGDASNGMPYTLNAVAAVVLGGTSLRGGAGSVLASGVGAAILATVGSLMFFLGIPPSAQPLFDGAVLLGAVMFGAIRGVRVRNRLEIFQ